MPPERRLRAAEAFWNDEHSEPQHLEAIAAIAQHIHFRAKSVRSLPPERLAKYLASLPRVSDSVALRALVAYHLETQRPMMSAFLDTLGVAHEDGLISEESLSPPPADRLRAAAGDLAARFPEDDVRLYFETLVSQDPETWGALKQNRE
jgi:hypothetical protein